MGLVRLWGILYKFNFERYIGNNQNNQNTAVLRREKALQPILLTRVENVTRSWTGTSNW